MCQHFQLRSQTVNYSHQLGFGGAGFDTRLCTEAEKEDCNTCPLSESSCPKCFKELKGKKKKKKLMLLSVFYDWPKPKSMQVEMGQWVTQWPWRPATKLSIVPKVWGAALLPIALIKAGTQPGPHQSMEMDRYIQCTSYPFFWTPPFA